MSYYRLELWPTEEGIQYYKEYATTNRSNDNAGVDLYTVEDYIVDDKRGILHNSVHLLDLGTRARMVKVTPIDDYNNHEEDVHYWLCPRSSIYKSGVMMANSQGVVDASYRGLLKAPVTNLNEHTYPNITKGVRLFQIVAPDMGHILEIKIVNSLPETLRGSGGFGSTGTT
jgi:dUTPase